MLFNHSRYLQFNAYGLLSFAFKPCYHALGNRALKLVVAAGSEGVDILIALAGLNGVLLALSLLLLSFVLLCAGGISFNATSAIPLGLAFGVLSSGVVYASVKAVCWLESIVKIYENLLGSLWSTRTHLRLLTQ